MSWKTKIALSIMMFLLYCIWGSWYGQMSKYLSNQLEASGVQVGNAYAMFSIAMIASPFLVGLLADRYIAAQRLLGILSLMGAAILFWLINVEEPSTFIWVLLLYCLTFTPAISLTTSIAMRQMANPEIEFPPIRVFGTIAWIVIVNVVGWYGWGDKATIFQLALLLSLVLGVFSFFLPHTPPGKSKEPFSYAQLIGKDAFVLFKSKSFSLFFISSVLICIPLAFYYTWANPSLTDAYILAFPSINADSFAIENKMSLGQVSEIVFLLMLPFAYRKWGLKNIFIIGLLAWVIRFLFFGYGTADNTPWMLYLAILLHGVCYDFFFVSGQIYIDKKAGTAIKAQAQGLITLATYGIGMLLGNLIAGYVKDMNTLSNVTNWTNVWLVPAGIASLVLLLFMFFFKQEKI
ncbi:MAG: MFS transporter [Saprospiraceae bacterium]|jgi:nucleoside transporter|nr:MFS transporter [Saprospiraceae bacterium]MCF8317865.1 MFS transporter [Haliscomenobacter sp.]